MSSTLYWEPLHRKKHELSYETKAVLRKLWVLSNCPLDRFAVPKLVGIKAASTGVVCEEMQQLIDAIDKYDTIVLDEEY